MAKKELVENQVVSRLAKKGVKFTGKVIEFRPGSLGINALGEVDYLVNYLKYTVKLVTAREK